MFLLGLFCFCLVIAVFYRDTPIGVRMRRLLIEIPADRLSKLTWAKVIVSVSLIVFFAGALFVAFSMQDGVVIFMALPEVLAWMAAFDIATLLELSIVVMFAAASIRVGAVVRFVTLRVSNLLAPRLPRRAAKARERQTRPERPDRTTNDEETSGPEWSYAFET